MQDCEATKKSKAVELVLLLVKQHAIVVFSKTYCPWGSLLLLSGVQVLFVATKLQWQKTQYMKEVSSLNDVYDLQVLQTCQECVWGPASKAFRSGAWFARYIHSLQERESAFIMDRLDFSLGWFHQLLTTKRIDYLWCRKILKGHEYSILIRPS